jgi:hypothetical protein
MSQYVSNGATDGNMRGTETSRNRENNYTDLNGLATTFFHIDLTLLYYVTSYVP